MKKILTAAAAITMAMIMAFGLSACSVDFNSSKDINIEEISQFLENIDLSKIEEVLKNIDTDEIAAEIEDKGSELVEAIAGLIKEIDSFLSLESVSNEFPADAADDKVIVPEQQNLISDFDEEIKQHTTEDEDGQIKSGQGNDIESLEMLETILKVMGMEELYSEIENEMEEHPELAQALIENLTAEDMQELFSDSFSGESKGEKAPSGK